MNQTGFDFSAPVQPLGSPRTRHASAMGARDASERVGRQMLQLLTAYKQAGPDGLTDAEAAERTGFMRTSIIPRRRGLMKIGLVVEIGHRKNHTTGISNTTFGLA